MSLRDIATATYERAEEDKRQREDERGRRLEAERLQRRRERAPLLASTAAKILQVSPHEVDVVEVNDSVNLNNIQGYVEIDGLKLQVVLAADPFMQLVAVDGGSLLSNTTSAPLHFGYIRDLQSLGAKLAEFERYYASPNARKVAKTH